MKVILESPEYRELIKVRRRIVWPLAIIMMLAYYSFVLVIAFAPSVFAAPAGEGVTSVGIYAGLGLILFTFVLTGLYVHYANTKLEPLTKDIHEKYGKR